VSTGKSSSPYEGEIPFDQHGNPLPYVGKRFVKEKDLGTGEVEGCYEECGPRWNQEVIWAPNAEFDARLKFVRFERGRSAAHAVYRDAGDESWECQMFLTDLEELILAGLDLSDIWGVWEHCKRGTNYGVRRSRR
jgi:hypothetical protein